MDKLASAIGCIITGIFLFMWKNYTPFGDNKICWKDLLQNKTVCSLMCPNGSFALPEMDSCHTLLSCSDVISIKETLASSVVKKVYLAEWNDHIIVASQLSSPVYRSDFEENVKLHHLFGPNEFTVQYLGRCNDTIITKYYKLGNALNLNYHLVNSLKAYNSVALRLKLCIHYVAILKFLHSETFGKRVMCDSSTLEKTLSQYLLTDDLKLVINDLDALPEVNPNGVVCGKKQLTGVFNAPEQLWFFKGNFTLSKMPPYDEKTDIWKIPDVCTYFLDDNINSDLVKFKLFPLHKRCKNLDPNERPDADFVLKSYQNLWNELFLQ